MGKLLDITNKLTFDGNPKIVIRGKEYEVNADAATVLKIMGVIGDGENVTAKDVVDLYELLFSEKTRHEIDKLKLSFTDLQTLIDSAATLVTGDETAGEA